jgi:hypothetical protein
MKDRQGGGWLKHVLVISERADAILLYENKRRGLIALSKGPSGERAFADAFNAWQQQAARQ